MMGWFSWLYYMLLFLFMISSSVSSSSISPSSPSPLCHIDDSNALLQFKNSFPIAYSYAYSFSTDYSYASFCDGYYKTRSWKSDTDCCAWSGVTCNNITGHVISLDLSCGMLRGAIHSNSSLFLLRHLQSLILSMNDFKGSTIPSEFGKFVDLRHLEIRFSNLSGDIPIEISYLSKLQTLEVFNPDHQLRLNTSTFKRMVTNLTNLQNLALGSVDMTRSEPVSLMNLSSSLKSLALLSCGLRGNLPSSIFHLPKLEKLSLGDNENLIGSLPKYNWSSSLKQLRLSGTKFLIDIFDLTRNLKSLDTLFLNNCTFIGSYPVLFGNLTQLAYLDLSHNNIPGQIPLSSFNLQQLVALDLSGNNFIGELPKFVSYNSTQISFSSNSSSTNKLLRPVSWHIEELDLSDNLLNGTLPNWLYSLPSLQFLDLDRNEFTGHIQEFQTTSLMDLDLSNNKLNGSIPISIFQQVNLTRLDLSSNSLSGFVPINDLSLNYRHPFSPIYSNHSLANLTILPHLFYLNLSHNHLTHIADRIPWKNLQFLDVRSNLLHGQLPIPPPSIGVFLASHNQLNGEVPSLICNLSFLQVLDLANNQLSGKLPPCIGNLSGSLSVLDLRTNKFHGTIPTTMFAKENTLRNLNLNGNELEGSLPRSLLNCKKLEVLDIGNNRINGTFPNWLESLPVLHVLVLRSNRFYGSISNPTVRFPFRMLRILDLSNNEFSGKLPAKHFERLTAMMEANTSKLEYMGGRYYEDSVFVAIKGNFIELVKILTVFTTIDLSKNHFEGEIPELLGNLKSLKGLNLSRNKLTDSIPPSLGNLSGLEWLDLSSNVLAGGIPQQLTNIPSLAVLNLSQNRLVGPIPHGKQFDTFENTSYIPNLGLCGFPLTKTCSNSTDEAHQEGDDDYEETDTFDLWKIIVMGYGSGIVIGISMGYIVLSDRRIALFMRKFGGQRWIRRIKWWTD